MRSTPEAGGDRTSQMRLFCPISQVSAISLATKAKEVAARSKPHATPRPCVVDGLRWARRQTLDPAKRAVAFIQFQLLVCAAVTLATANHMRPIYAAGWSRIFWVTAADTFAFSWRKSTQLLILSLAGVTEGV
jgi:hypothetical protein